MIELIKYLLKGENYEKKIKYVSYFICDVKQFSYRTNQRLC